MILSELASKLDYDIVGNSELEVIGIAYPNEAKKAQIAIIKNKSEINSTEAEIVLTQPRFLKTNKTMLMTFDEIEHAMIKICRELIIHGDLIDYSLPVKYKKNEREFYVGTNTIIDNTSYIAPNVMVGNYVEIGKNCIIEPNVVIGSGTKIANNVHVGAGTKIGAESFYHIFDGGKMLHFSGIGQTVILEGVHIGCNSIVQRGTISDTVIGGHTMVGNCVDIGHDVKIGTNCKVVSQTGIAGDVTIKNNVIIYGQSGIANNIVIGNNVIVKAKTLVSKSIDDDQIVFGLYGRNSYEELRLQAKMKSFFERKE